LIVFILHGRSAWQILVESGTPTSTMVLVSAMRYVSMRWKIELCGQTVHFQLQHMTSQFSVEVQRNLARPHGRNRVCVIKFRMGRELLEILVMLVSQTSFYYTCGAFWCNKGVICSLEVETRNSFPWLQSSGYHGR
jgi:hypothetical protein